MTLKIKFDLDIINNEVHAKHKHVTSRDSRVTMPTIMLLNYQLWSWNVSYHLEFDYDIDSINISAHSKISFLSKSIQKYCIELFCSFLLTVTSNFIIRYWQLNLTEILQVSRCVQKQFLTVDFAVDLSFQESTVLVFFFFLPFYLWLMTQI